MGRGKKERGSKRRDNRSSEGASSNNNNNQPLPPASIGNAASLPGATDAFAVAAECLRGGIQIQSVGGEDGMRFMYSYNHGNGRPEYYVANVPAAKEPQVANAINSIANIENVGDRHSMRSQDNLLFWLNLVEGETKACLLREKCLFMNHFSKGAPIYELRPRFECSVTDSWWGGRPPAPNNQETIVDEILRTWEEQKDFNLEIHCEASDMGEQFITSMRTLFHDVDEVGLGNILIPRHKRVDLTIALKHVDDWKVDWDKSLNDEQIQFVKEHCKYFRSLTRVLFRAKPVCDHCGALEGLMKCSGCRSTQYCSRECHLADWKSHKEWCKQYKAMRNSQLDDIPIQKMERAVSKLDNQKEELFSRVRIYRTPTISSNTVCV